MNEYMSNEKTVFPISWPSAGAVDGAGWRAKIRMGDAGFGVILQKTTQQSFMEVIFMLVFHIVF